MPRLGDEIILVVIILFIYLFHAYFICIFEGYHFVAKCLSRADLAMFFLYDFGWSTLVFVLGAFFSFWKFNRFLCVPFCHHVCCLFFSPVCQADVRLVESGRKDSEPLSRRKLWRLRRVLWLTLEDTLTVLTALLTVSMCWTFYKL